MSKKILRTRQKKAILHFVLVAAFTFAAWATAGASQDGSYHLKKAGSRSTFQINPPIGQELNFVFEQAEIVEVNPFFNDFEEGPDSSGASIDDRKREKANELELVELVIDEFDFFAGLRNTFHHFEHAMDEYIERMKLKGGVNFSEENSRLDVRENLKFDGGLIVCMKQAFGSNGILKAMVPDHINWSIRSDLSGRYLIGEFEIGRYMFMEGSLGEEEEYRMIFEISF